MKIHTTPPKRTPQGHFIERMAAIWQAHPECLVPVGDVAPCSEVISGAKCMVVRKLGPLMVVRYVPKAYTQWLFDSHGT